VIKLPTAAAFLTNPWQNGDQVAAIYAKWISDELQAHPDALVLMPLLNLDEAYGPSYVGMNSVVQAMHHATGRANIDPARVYMVGHSMSAHAVWNIALHEPTYFAAINPLAGSASADWQRLRAMNLRNVFCVVWHDADDQVIKVARARELVKVLTNYKCDVDYEETKNIGHIPTDDIVRQEYGKMRARTRELYPKKVALRSNRPDTLFNRSDWVQVYQMLRPGSDRKLFFRHGSGHMTITDNAYTLEADRIGPTQLQVKSDNVESMRFYFNDQMLDMSKPYTISVNGKVRFEGIIKPSVAEMLKDQVFLGRGWRYFTGVVDIDFGEIVPYLTPGKPTTRQLLVRPPKPAE
jgi:predicted esterase